MHSDDVTDVYDETILNVYLISLKHLLIKMKLKAIMTVVAVIQLVIWLQHFHL